MAVSTARPARPTQPVRSVQPDTSPTPVGAPRSLSLIWTVTLTSIASFMVSLDALVVLTALPAIHRDLGASLATLNWTVNAYTLAYAAGVITAAALGDRFGRRRVFVIGLAIFSLASAACALAPNVSLLIAFRVLQGMGAAIVIPLSLTILTAAFPPARRGAIVGLWGGIGGLAVAGGPLVGGAITQGLDWHWIFWVNVPIGLVAAALSILFLAESRGPATRFDLPAVALVSAGACGLVWGLVHAGDRGWSDAGTLVALGLGVALLAAFVAWEQRAPEPMLPLRLFRSQIFTAANITGFLMSAGITGAAFLVTQYFQLGLGFAPLATGLRLLPWTATPIVFAPIAGMLSDRVGRRPIMVAGMALQGIGLLWMSLLAAPGVGYAILVMPLVIMGVGMSMALATTSTAVLSAVAPQDLGKASGANSTLQRFGSVFGVAVATAVFAAHGHLGAPTSFDAGFRPALMMIASLSLVGVASAAAVGSWRRLPGVASALRVATLDTAPTRQRV